MTCVEEGTLLEYLDRELDRDRSHEVARHLENCAACHARSEEIAAGSAVARSRLGTLSTDAASPDVNAAAALARLRARTDDEAEVTSGWFSPRLRALSGSLALVAVVVIALSFAPIRGWAQRLLALFRVQHITVVGIPSGNIDPDAVSRTRQLIMQTMSDQVTITQHPGPVDAKDAATASQLAGFSVRLPSHVPGTPRLLVKGEQTIQMVMDRERLEAILREAGRSDLSLPDALDGATVSVRIPKGLFALYGDCANAGEPRPEAGPMRLPENCVALAQLPSPTVSVPPNIDVSQLAEIALQVAGMTAEQAHEFCQTIDWTSTLVVPVPLQATTHQNVNVDGVQGVLISTNRLPITYTLLWVRDGMLYGLHGSGDAGKALAIANSLE